MPTFLGQPSLTGGLKLRQGDAPTKEQFLADYNKNIEEEEKKRKRQEELQRRQQEEQRQVAKERKFGGAQTVSGNLIAGLKEAPRKLGSAVGIFAAHPAGEIVPPEAQQKLFSPSPDERAEAQRLIDDATQKAKGTKKIEKYSHVERLVTGAAASGFTGGAVAPTEEPQGRGERITSAVAQTVGTVASLGMINLGLTRAMSKVPALVNVAAKYPKTLAFAKSVGVFDIYGQLNPELGVDLGDRAKQAAHDTVMGIMYEVAGFIPKKPIRVPAAAALTYGSAKAQGATTEDALIQAGIVGGLSAITPGHKQRLTELEGEHGRFIAEDIHKAPAKPVLDPVLRDKSGLEMRSVPPETIMMDQPRIEDVFRQEATKRQVIKDVAISDNIREPATKMEAPARTRAETRTTEINPRVISEDVQHLMKGDPIETPGGVFKRQPNESQADLTRRYIQEIIKFEEKHIQNKTVEQAQAPDQRKVAVELDQKAVEQTKKERQIFSERSKRDPDEAIKSQVLMEMSTAEAGKRFFNEQGEVIASQSSSFPQWVPEHLRSTKLFEKVMDQVANDKAPNPKNSRQVELYNVVQNRINEQLELPKFENFPGKEFKTRGVSQSVSDRAVAEKLSKPFKDLPEYATMDMKEQSRMAVDLLKQNPEQARKIAMGEEAPPAGLTPEIVFKAVENKAVAEADVATLQRLANESALTREGTIMGQRIAALGQRDPESPVAAMKEIREAREARVKKIYKQEIREVQKQEAKSLKETLKKAAPTKETWASFVQSLQC